MKNSAKFNYARYKKIIENIADKIDFPALYFTLCTELPGTKILITNNGAVERCDGTAVIQDLPNKWVYFGNADGEVDWGNWGIEKDDDTGNYIVVDAIDDQILGPFNNESDALQAAIDEYGLPPHYEDKLKEQYIQVAIEQAKDRQNYTK